MTENTTDSATPAVPNAPAPTDPLVDLDRVFAEFQSDWFGSGWPGFSALALVPASEGHPALAPARADVEEKDGSYEIRADLPGIPKDQIDVRVRGDLVEIRGEHAAETESKGKNYLRQERTYRGFERTFRLPEPVLGDKVEAKFENGTLTVSIPKAHPIEERKVAVA
jgi:HSP20 family protein